MSGNAINVDLEPREVVGKGLRSLRDGGKLPAVIHDHGRESMHVMGDYASLTKAFQEAGRHHPVDINLGGQHHLALIKEVDVEPIKNRVRHIVFQAIKQDEKVEAEIPVVLEGDIPAEKASLMVITGVDTITVAALPKDLPDEIKVDASVLAEIGDKIQVSDLTMPEGVDLVTEPEQMIAHVEQPKDQIAEADAAAAALAEDAAAHAEGEEGEAGESATGEASESGETAADGGEASAPDADNKD